MALSACKLFLLVHDRYPSSCSEADSCSCVLDIGTYDPFSGSSMLSVDHNAKLAGLFIDTA